MALSDGGDPELLAALKALRLRLARERQVPAYVIFSDRTLIDMAALRPHDLDEFCAGERRGRGQAEGFRDGVFEGDCGAERLERRRCGDCDEYAQTHIHRPR